MPWTDEEIDRRMGLLLQGGVLVSAAVMIAGGIVYLIDRRHLLSDYSQFQTTGSALRTIPEIFRVAALGDGAALIQVGTLLMIATPVVRVAFAIYAFLRSHDRMYVVISSIVLLLLGYGLLFGS